MASASHNPPPSGIQNGVKRELAEYTEDESLVKMIQDDLNAGRITIDGCREIIHYLRDQGAPARHGLEDILAVKGQRAGDAVNRAAETVIERIAADLAKRNTRSPST